MRLFTKTCVLILTVLVVFSANAQDEGFIYGKVYTIDNKVYEGPIRWGKEEVYWTDIFNAGKERNQNLRYLSSRDRDKLDDRQNTWDNWNNNNWYRWFGNWGDKRNDYDNDYEHQFACQFGEIKAIIPSGRKYVDLEMQNGDKVSLKGEGYNDVGGEIRIMDPEMGDLDMDWGRIRKIEFMKTPKTLSNRFGIPLYGKVEAFGETFTGYIQWDHDERLSTDKLDGDADDGNISLEFSKIVSIERRGGRSIVKLKSGRELTMEGSNDVDNGNRGVIIMNKDMIAVDVPWREFDKVTFSEPSGSLASYDQFATQKPLSGSVVTKDGKSLTGKIVFDLDEESTYELLQGKQGDFEVTTPFRDVKRLEPISDYRCSIELKSGNKITLEDAQDVNDRNQGVLVFANAKSDPVYVLWEDVKSIDFN
ncbi:MAG: hypothetical protein ACK5RG_08840 [Cyclobacteriaceae bacterium]|jgi:hypothetical protein|nr:hypothetical protein [Flammeovirgaceae bacterium]